MTAKRDYRFIDKDPVIDLVRTAYLDSNMMISAVAERARIAPSTLENWLFGETKRPQNRTLEAVFEVLGIETRRIYVATGETLVARPGVSRIGKKTLKEKNRERRRAQLKVVTGAAA